MNLPTSVTDDDARLKDLTPSWKQQLRSMSKDMLIEEEVRRRKYVTTALTSMTCILIAFFRAVKMNLANEGLEARKKEEEVAAKKRKAEDDATWEGWCDILAQGYVTVLTRLCVYSWQRATCG